ncbi:prefoldin subunit alpha [Candidatus Pacearchaeota archaeon]|nr:prefoldin subunit alpha [Candidatus Pacearchaeota archaeon]
MDEKQQELIFKLGMYEQQIQQLQQQLQAVEQGVFEMTLLSQGLGELVGSVDKEILAPIGRGIFLKTKLLSEDLTVDIGNKTFVKKTIPEAQEMIKEQIKKLEDVKRELNDSLDKVGGEMERVVEEGREKGMN